MQLKSVIISLALALGVSACSVNKVVYRIDVPQGNYLEADTVAKVQPGMNKEQVQYLLGTPVLISPFGIMFICNSTAIMIRNSTLSR